VPAQDDEQVTSLDLLHTADRKLLHSAGDGRGSGQRQHHAAGMATPCGRGDTGSISVIRPVLSDASIRSRARLSLSIGA
jgi:hypothetical protein